MSARPSLASGSVVSAALTTRLPQLTRERSKVLAWMLRLATAGMLVGHGAYGAIMEKPGWYDFFSTIGVDKAAVDRHSLLTLGGGFEIVLGIAALIYPMRALLLFIGVWKFGSEFVYWPLAKKPAFEFVERWANYTAPLALLLVRGWPRSWRDWFQ